MEQKNKGDVFLKAFFDLLAADYIEDAVKNLRKAFKEGNLRAMYWLGKLHYNGWLGCQHSNKRAIDMWNASSEYGPSTVLLNVAFDHKIYRAARRPTLKVNDIPLARAMYYGSPDTVRLCDGNALEFYYLAASHLANTGEQRVEYYRQGASRGCTRCLIWLYRDMRITPWERRRLWRHCPKELDIIPPYVEEGLYWIPLSEFGCKENVRHIVCLLMWARKTQNSPVLATLPRDVLRLICVRLLRTSSEETQDEALVWNHMPKKKRRKTRK